MQKNIFISQIFKYHKNNVIKHKYCIPFDCILIDGWKVNRQVNNTVLYCLIIQNIIDGTRAVEDWQTRGDDFTTTRLWQHQNWTITSQAPDGGLNRTRWWPHQNPAMTSPAQYGDLRKIRRWPQLYRITFTTFIVEICDVSWYACQQERGFEWQSCGQCIAANSWPGVECRLLVYSCCVITETFSNGSKPPRTCCL